jgi:glutamine amidotransferase
MKQPNIVIVDYEVGNTFSVTNAISFLGYRKIKISASDKIIRNADVMILPGVGAFEACANNLRARSLDKILEEQVFGYKKPILGICVGMQLFANTSEENGIHSGLNWIPESKVIKLNLSHNFAVPHVGWNSIKILSRDPLFTTNVENSNFYFDHSYYFSCENKFISAYCEYDIPVTAAVQHENIFGVQFHPEKSQNNGLRLFRNFFNSI